MWKLIAFVLFATAATAQEAPLHYPDAPGWYLIGPIKADGHKIPVAYNFFTPYTSEAACEAVMSTDEFRSTFRKWQEYEIEQHEGNVVFGPPECIEVKPGLPL